MSQETELQQLHAELNKIKGSLRKTTRRSLVGMLILVFVTLTSFVYAFVKQVEAERNAEAATQQRILAEQSKVQADMNAEEANRQRGIANEINRLLDECRQGEK